MEPLNERPKRTLPAPPKASLPPLPDIAIVPSQAKPFTVPADAADFLNCLIAPVKDVLANMAPCAEGAPSAHPFKGGETAAHSRLTHLLLSEGMTKYKDTRNGLVGTEFSTKLSAYLAQGCVTARQIHEQLCAYENGSDTKYGDVPGYGKGENEGTKAVRFELLWRDYMRLCTGKFKHRLFRLDGFRGGYAEAGKPQKWKTANEKVAVADQDPSPERVTRILERFKAGTTGMGLIDASQRELLHTGYTSNRARQNVASFLAKHLGIDWRYGAEWYEMLLVDYDVSSNWANWQYVAGVGNDPRGEARIFNPVKQAFDYDKQGQYVRMWVPEVAKLEKLENVFQAWTASEEDLKEVALLNNVMVTDPIKRIPFSVEGKPKNSKRPYTRRRGQGCQPSQNVNGDGSGANGAPPNGPAVSDGQRTGPSNSVHGGPRGNYRGGFRGRGQRGGRGGSSTARGGYGARPAFGPGLPPLATPAPGNA